MSGLSLPVLRAIDFFFLQCESYYCKYWFCSKVSWLEINNHCWLFCHGYHKRFITKVCVCVCVCACVRVLRVLSLTWFACLNTPLLPVCCSMGMGVCVRGGSINMSCDWRRAKWPVVPMRKHDKLLTQTFQKQNTSSLISELERVWFSAIFHLEKYCKVTWHSDISRHHLVWLYNRKILLQL